MARLLVVEDETKVLRSLERGLRAEGYDVVTAATGEEGYRQAARQSFDCLVLDLMLPGRDGLQVLSDLRREGRKLPVLVLTARDAVQEDLIERRVARNGAEIALTHREFEVLAFLLRHKNASVTRDMLGREIWKEPFIALTNVVEVYVNALRRKLEKAGVKPLIQTIRGVGYRLCDEP